VPHIIARVFDFADVPPERAAIGPELQRQVDAARVRVGVKARARVREVVRFSDSTADEILNVAQQEKADLLVLGTHGYGAFKRALIGSVAAAVARAAVCPVLLVPPALWAGESD
jgi:nucleotide-binding universal stress UspA family protein